MILPFLVALPVALGLLLRGAADIWAQAIIHIVTVAGLVLWSVSKTAVGYLPRPSNRNLLWTMILTVGGSLTVLFSPISSLALPGWYNFLNALWLFPIMAVVSKDERRQVDLAIRGAAWVLMVLAFYQRIRLGEANPASALVDENVYAGAILLLLPLALEQRDWLLSAGLLVNLVWTGSVGAWLGLSGALMLTRRRSGDIGFWAGLGGGFICAVLIYNQFQSPEVLQRVQGWRAAVAMVNQRPFLGFGPGSLEHVLPAFGVDASSAFAHQYFLETVAEYGILFAIVWFAGLWSCVMRGSSYKRFGALAVLIHAMWDWSLSLPANLWLFSYFSASSLTEEPRGINVPARFKLPVCLLIVTSGWFLCVQAWNLWTAPLNPYHVKNWEYARR